MKNYEPHIITQIPPDRFASNFGWGTWQNHRNDMGLTIPILVGLDFLRNYSLQAKLSSQPSIVQILNDRIVTNRLMFQELELAQTKLALLETEFNRLMFRSLSLNQLRLSQLWWRRSLIVWLFRSLSLNQLRLSQLWWRRNVKTRIQHINSLHRYTLFQ